MENSETTSKTPDVTTEGAGAGAQGAEQPGQELLDELTQLADKFATVVRSAWNSDQRKQIETDVRAGLTTMASSIEDGLNQVASSNEAKDLQTKATEVGEKVTSSKFFADLSGALTTGLRALSDQLDKLSNDLQSKPAAPPPPASTEEEAREIPIQKE